MAHTEASLSKLNKEDIIRLALDLQQKHDSLLSKLQNDFADLKINYSKMEADLSIVRTVSDNMKNHIIKLERKCWSNEQYSRRECLEISGIPETVTDTELEGKVSDVLKKIDCGIKPKNIEACHWIKTKNGGRRVIIKCSKRKDVDRIRKNKKKLKTVDLRSLNIHNPVYINDSLCWYYKSLWIKCKRLRDANQIHSFWVTNGSIRMKLSESSRVQEISHICDLEEYFPGSPLLEDKPNVE